MDPEEEQEPLSEETLVLISDLFDSPNVLGVTAETTPDGYTIVEVEIVVSPEEN